jgi:hypothetical protein
MKPEIERGDSRFELRTPTLVDRDGSSSLRTTAESSSGDPNSSATEHSGQTVSMTFPERLFGFLECEEFRDTIWWNSDGDVFNIDPKLFTERVLKRQCRGVQFESFTRSLHRWGFKRIVDKCFPKNVRVYRRDMFQRNKPELLQKIKTGKKAEISSREHLQVADNKSTFREGEDSSLPMSSRHGFLQSNPLDEQLSPQSGFAGEATPLRSLRDSHILPSRFVAYRAITDHQHQVCSFRSVADLNEHKLHRIRQEQAQVLLFEEAQKEILAAETNRRLHQAQKEQKVARVARFSQILNSSASHLALHSLHDVSRAPCGVLGVQCVMQSSLVNPSPSSRMFDKNSRTNAQTAAQATSQVGSSKGLVVSTPMDLAMNNDTVARKNLSSVLMVCTSSQSSAGKRSRQVSEQDASDEDSDDDSNNDCTEKRRRTARTVLWTESFHELMNYRQRTGNCLVPYSYKKNQTLARWVKRQRYQYKLMIEGHPSSAMTEERVTILEEAGFVWDSQAASWEERLEELKVFRKTRRHCNVPTGYIDNISLGNWVQCQRRQYMLLKEGRKSNMTTQRVHDLESVGFEWQLRPSRYPKKKNQPV